MSKDGLKKIAVVGGGAAGMMAAAAIKEAAPDAEVWLFEKNAYLGAKVIISGGGRCNVTTGIFDVRKLLENYPRGAKFLMSAMFRLPPEKVMAWFEDRGVRLKIEEDLRVFPVSNNGKEVVAALESELREKGVQIVLNANVAEVGKEGGQFLVGLKNGERHSFDGMVLTTGGNAYRHTGSTGDGYAFAKALGHTITPLAASLHSFLVGEKWVAKVAGVSFEKVEVTLKPFDGKQVYKRGGPLVFTHHGVSGPVIFALSSMAAYEDFSKEKPLAVKINFFPDETAEMLKKRLAEAMEHHGAKRVVNFLDMFLPKSLCEVFTEILGIQPELVAARLNREQLAKILDLLQGLTLGAVGRGAGDEFVTAGGVDLNEVNTNTMESKICPGLYFAGEILDIDGFTGGFNLQASWATGMLAGDEAAIATAVSA